MKILITLRSYEHIPYVYKLINKISSENKVVLLLDSAWSPKGLEELKNHPLINNTNIKYELLYTSNSYYQKMKKSLLELITSMSYLHREETTNFYIKRWINYQPKTIQYLLRFKFFKKIMKTKILFRILYGIYLRLPISPTLTNYLNHNNFDALIVTACNLRFSNENEYILGAKKIGIPIHYPVLSWDNLTTKSIVLKIIDFLYVWNIEQKNYLKKIHHISGNKVIIAGSLFFEKWLNFEFSAKSNKREYFLYLGSSANIKKNEVENIKHLYDQIKKEFNDSIELIVRSHPAKLIDLNNLKTIIIDKKSGLTHTSPDEHHLANLIHNAKCIFGLNTSAMIDCYALGNKCYAILDNKINDTQRDSLHFKQMHNENIINVIKHTKIKDIILNNSIKEQNSLNMIFNNNKVPSEIICANIKKNIK